VKENIYCYLFDVKLILAAAVVCKITLCSKNISGIVGDFKL